MLAVTWTVGGKMTGQVSVVDHLVALLTLHAFWYGLIMWAELLFDKNGQFPNPTTPFVIVQTMNSESLYFTICFSLGIHLKLLLTTHGASMTHCGGRLQLPQAGFAEIMTARCQSSLATWQITDLTH